MTREEVERTIVDCLRRVGLPADYRMPETSDGCATPHVEGDAAPFAYLVSERGNDLKRVEGLKGDEIVFLIVSGKVRDHATGLEARLRGGGASSRWSWMELHIRMMDGLRPEWGRRVAGHYERVLAGAPMSDVERSSAMRLPLPGER